MLKLPSNQHCSNIGCGIEQSFQTQVNSELAGFFLTLILNTHLGEVDGAILLAGIDPLFEFNCHINIKDGHFFISLHILLLLPTLCLCAMFKQKYKNTIY